LHPYGAVNPLDPQLASEEQTIPPEDEIDGDCDDLIDNDGDGDIDIMDQACVNNSIISEVGFNECDDGIDNDGDGAIDALDGGCASTSGSDETNCMAVF